MKRLGVALVVAGVLLGAVQAAWSQGNVRYVPKDRSGVRTGLEFWDCAWIDWWQSNECGEDSYMREHGMVPVEEQQGASREAVKRQGLEEVGSETEAGQVGVDARDGSPVDMEEEFDVEEAEKAKAWQQYRLFPRESLAADSPELFAELLEEPTVENAIRYWLWYEARQERLQDVQDLIAEAALVIAARRGEGVPVTYDSGRGLTRTTEELLAEDEGVRQEGERYSATLR